MKISWEKAVYVSMLVVIDDRKQRTDSNSVCAECPKMNEKPRMIVANGTSDAMVSFLLKMSRQMKIRTRSTQVISTASNFATAEPTS